MNYEEFKKDLESFQVAVKVYRSLLLESRNRSIPKIEINQELISEQRSNLNRMYGRLDVYISKLGKNPKLNDGVWNIWYSPYHNAFTNDVLIRVGSSVDAVINDLDYIFGRLDGMTEKEFTELLGSDKKNDVKGVPITTKETANQLLKQIDDKIDLAKQKLLKGEELSELLEVLRKYEPSQDIGEIPRRKLEKISQEPNTVWKDDNGYAIGGESMLHRWREIFLEISSIETPSSQKYFPPGSRDEIFSYLKTLVPSGRVLKIYDNYLGEEILKLLEHISPEAEVYLLGRELDSKFLKKLPAFATYFEHNIKVRKTAGEAHARFYIIDDSVFNVDVSLRGGAADRATIISPVVKEEADKIMKDYDKWWKSATDV